MLYEPKVNSPVTSLSSGINSSVNEITVDDATVLPDAPNIATIGSGQNPETIRYTGKSGNILTGVTRGFEGDAQSWDPGDPVARVMTAYDLESVQDVATTGYDHAQTAHAPSDANNYIHPSAIQCNPSKLTPGTGLSGTDYDGKADRTFAVQYGTTSTTACVGNDARLSDDRDPNPHTHSANDVDSDVLHANRVPEILELRGYTLGDSTFLREDGSWSTPTGIQPGEHTHDADDVDSGVLHSARIPALAELTPGTGLSGDTYDTTWAQTFAVEYGTTSTTACVGNDSRLSDAREPTAHTHNADDVNAGTLHVDRIPNLSANKITSDTLHVNRIPNLSANKITSDVFHVDRIPDLNADKITGGELDAGRIPDLDASKITTGVFHSDRIPEIGVGDIPDLDADKITSGEFHTDRIPDLDADKITSGEFHTDRIPDLDAGKITSGEFHTDRIPSLATLTPGTGLSGNAYDTSSNQTFAVNYGTTSTTACVGNDARLSDAREPTAHNHAAGDVTSGTFHSDRIPSLATLTPGTGLSGSSYNTSTDRTFDVNFGDSAGTVCEGNDPRLEDSAPDFGPFEIVYNSATESLDFNYTG